MQALTGECWSSKKQKSASGKSGGSANEPKRCVSNGSSHTVSPLSNRACNRHFRIAWQDAYNCMCTAAHAIMSSGFKRICKKNCPNS